MQNDDDAVWLLQSRSLPESTSLYHNYIISIWSQYCNFIYFSSFTLAKLFGLVLNSFRIEMSVFFAAKETWKSYIKPCVSTFDNVNSMQRELKSFFNIFDLFSCHKIEFKYYTVSWPSQREVS